MDVLGTLPERVRTVSPPRQDHGEFSGKVDGRFGYCRFPSDGIPCQFRLVGGADPRLTLAVIAVAARFQDERQAEIGDSCVQIAFRRDCTPGRDTRSGALDEFLLARAIL